MYMYFIPLGKLLRLTIITTLIYILFSNMSYTICGFDTFRSKTMQRIRPLKRNIEGLIYRRKPIK